MTDSTQTLVIKSVDHAYIFPVILIIFFGVILLYNIYGIFELKKQEKLLSKAEEMILEGHKKLVDNREELFVEGGNALDANFILDEITENDRMLANLDPEEVARRERKAAERQRKRDELNEKERLRAEKKRMRAEEAKARKMTPKKRRIQTAKEILVYDAAYNALEQSVNRDMEEIRRSLNNMNKRNEKRFAFINSKYKNPELIQIQKEEQRRQEKARKAVINKKAAKAAKKASKNADISVFSGDDI